MERIPLHLCLLITEIGMRKVVNIVQTKKHSTTIVDISHLRYQKELIKGNICPLSRLTTLEGSRLNQRLHDYFSKKYTNHSGVYIGEQAIEGVNKINEYIKFKYPHISPLLFEATEMEKIFFIPITEHIKVIGTTYCDNKKMLTLGEALISNNTTEKDMDAVNEWIENLSLHKNKK